MGVGPLTFDYFPCLPYFLVIPYQFWKFWQWDSLVKTFWTPKAEWDLKGPPKAPTFFSLELGYSGTGRFLEKFPEGPISQSLDPKGTLLGIFGLLASTVYYSFFI